MQRYTTLLPHPQATMANLVHAPLVVFSHAGGMPTLLSHFRPNYPTFAFCDNEEVCVCVCAACCVMCL